MSAMPNTKQLNEDIFDEKSFINEIEKSESTIPVYKKFLSSGLEQLKQGFTDSWNSRALVSKQAKLVDHLLSTLLHEADRRFCWRLLLRHRCDRGFQ